LAEERDGRRTVLVTGGSRGLGLAIVRLLAETGYCVIAIARTRSEPLAALETSGDVHFQSYDLGEMAGLPELVKSVRKQYGPLFGLINNAGIGTPGVLANMPDRQIELLIRLNTLAPITLTRHVVRAMLAGGGGRIVNISSIGAFTGYSGLSVYNATKASLIGFTRSLARELGPIGITVNAVAPGFVETDMTGSMDEAAREQVRRRSALRRMPEAGDVASAVQFLLSEGARNITGTVLTVDAGSTA
jgi:3-oxoacyl-[acyl-carrier protein] reductase